MDKAQAADFNKKEEDAFYVAVKSYEDGFYDVSLTLFDRFLKTYINSDKKIEAFIYMGQCYFYQEKYLKALEQFESLLKMEAAGPFKDKILFWLGEIYAKGRAYKQAAAFYKELIDNHRDSHYRLSAYRSLAAVQTDAGHLTQAVATHRKIISEFQDIAVDEESAFSICELLYRLKDYAQLKSELLDFVSFYPRSARSDMAYFYLGEANFYLNEYGLAIEAYENIENVSSSEEVKTQAQIGLGWSYLKLKKWDEAEKIFSGFSDEGQPPGVVLGKAVLATGLGDFERSFALYGKVIASDKQGGYLPLAFFGKAEALYNLLRFDQAIIAYRISLDKLKVTRGGFAENKELRDKIHYGLAWSYLKVGDFKSAQEEFQKVASLSSDKMVKLSALCQLGDTYQDAGDYKKAVQTYQGFLRDYPDSVYNDYIQYQLGMAWLKTENLESAVLAFRKLLKDYPSSKLVDDANYFIGVTYFQKGDFLAAQQQLEKFVDDFKDSSYRPQAVFLLAESLINQSRWKAGIDVFQRIIKEFAAQETLRQKAEYEIANAYARMGQEAEADKRLSDFIARYPDSQMSPDIIFWLGQSHMAKKDFSAARKYFERLIRNYPVHELIGEAFLEIASSYIEEGSQEAAVRSLRQAKDYGKGATPAKACVLLGDIYLAKDDLPEALANYQEASCEGGAWSKTAYVKMAAVYRRMKAFREAVSALEKALSTEGPASDPQIQFSIAELLEEAGFQEEAMEAYLKVSYLYPQEATWVVKALLRIARIYELKENWPEYRNILKRIAAYRVPEAKYAQEKLDGLKDF